MVQELNMEQLQNIEGGRDWWKTLEGVADAGLGTVEFIAGVTAPITPKEKAVLVISGLRTYIGGLETIYNAY